jgi:hypothetical protein
VDIRREPRQYTRQPYPYPAPLYYHPSDPLRRAPPPPQPMRMSNQHQPSIRTLTPAPRRPLCSEQQQQHISHDYCPYQHQQQAANADITDSVISTYFHPSPYLPSAPQRLYTRQEAALAPLSRTPERMYTYLEKPLPPDPRHNPPTRAREGDVYDAIARAVRQ